MKKISILLAIIFALSINSNAQLNYLFSATTKPYTAVQGGIAPPLLMVDPTNANPPWTLSDEGFAQVPIGFVFNYNGKDYDSATIYANGFVTLGDTMFRRLRPLSLYRNFLARGPFPVDGIKPVLAPFWDDLDIVDVGNLVYTTTGHAPFRVFTVEWKNTKWTFESTQPAFSMELKLYEKTNVIEFHYKDEGGLPFTPRAFASIGITSSYNYRAFMSLQNASSNPSISLLRANDSITTKPANNQLYTFTPSTVNMPELIVNSKFYTDQSAGYKVNFKGPGNLEYAFTTSATTPLSGIETSNENISVANLAPATTYYVYTRAVKNKNFYSQWSSDSFKTAVTPVPVPYRISDNPNVYPYLPPDVRVQDMNDTSSNHFPNSDGEWNVISDFIRPGANLWAINTYHFYSADSWLFTPGLQLTGGKTYQFSFAYLCLFSESPEEEASVEIKWGNASGAAGMTQGTLFKKDDMKFGADVIDDPVTDTTIYFTPSLSGNYYFGFHNLTRFTGNPGAYPILADILVSEKPTSLERPFVLAARENESDNVLNWTAPGNKSTRAFEIQRSADGINFTEIDEVTAPKINSSRASKVYTDFKIQRNTQITNEKKGNKYFEPNNQLLAGSPHQSVFDKVNFKKPGALTSKDANQTARVGKYDYIDRGVAGTNYYRLQHAAPNGQLSYSNVVKVESKAPLISIYPNPVIDVLNVEVKNARTARMNMVVTDANGKTVINRAVEVANTKGINRVQLALSKLPAGTYSLKILCSDGRRSAVTKFVKQ